MVDALWKRTASELAQLIRTRQVSSREVVEAHLARIEETNGYVNAVTVVLAESALASADEADRSQASGPLHGVPFTIKENIDCVGSATTDGVELFVDAFPARDAAIVARMKAAGAVPLGRTNLPEFGARLDTDNPLRGRTRNPWNGGLTPGGSSGGEAAALACGMTPIGLGNDIGGSLRNPAYCCGIAALKPTPGRIPAGREPLDARLSAQTMLVDGPMARSVADLRLGLSVIAGRDLRDPRSVDVPLDGPQPESLRAALVTEVPGCVLPEATVAEIRRAGSILSANGWVVDEVQPPELERVTEVWGHILTLDMDTFETEAKDYATPALYSLMLAFRQLLQPSGLSHTTVHAERTRLTQLWSSFLTDYTVAVGPTWTRLPWPIDADLDPSSGPQLMVDSVRFITPGNALGLPAVALPTGVADGLATGIQIYAELWREDLCLRAAETIEREVDTPTPIDPVR